MQKIFLAIFIFFNGMAFSQQNWKLSIQTWTFHQYSLLESIDKADSLGLKYIEVYPGQ